MSTESHFHYRFDDFYLDVENRQLRQGARKIDLNGRYFDALVLLVREHGQLVGKDQFFSEVWRDVVVSDSALTQCIKDIRKKLGDNAANPRYIQTVPGYGYQFVGPVKAGASANNEPTKSIPATKSGTLSAPTGSTYQINHGLLIGGLGTLGGMAAGLLGGLFYGFWLAYSPVDTEIGAISMLLVLTTLTVIIGGMGGLGVSSGMALAIVLTDDNKIWTVLGTAFGGLVVGSLTKLVGVDAFNLLFGMAPEGITGGLEGAFLGAAVALGAVFGGGLKASHRMRPVVAAASASGVAGVLISIAGGRLMSGSLELLTRSFTGSKLHLETFGRFFGETNFGFIAQTVLAGVEGFLFGACVIGSVVYLQEWLSDRKSFNT